MDFLGFYQVLPSFTKLYLDLPGFTEFSWVSMDFTGFYWVLMDFTGFSWIAPCSYRELWVLGNDDGITGFLLSFLGNVLFILPGNRSVVGLKKKTKKFLFFLNSIVCSSTVDRLSAWRLRRCRIYLLIFLKKLFFFLFLFFFFSFRILCGTGGALMLIQYRQSKKKKKKTR